MGRRISKKDAFGETHFLWNGDVLLSETRKNHQKLYIYEPDSFKPLAHIENNQCYFYHLDHLGTPQEITDWEGHIVWSGKYKAYGNLALKPVEEVDNNLRFQGQYYDEETGLHYNRHRYYDPGIGQFISQDPVGLIGGENSYQYAGNPTGWVDPFGLTCKEGDGLQAAGSGVAKGGDDTVNVFRAFGGDARAQGFSWTTKDPRKVENFRDAAGLPSGRESGATNTAEFLIQGEAKAILLSQGQHCR
ncbi:MAG: hypothetical protein CSA49_06835 [Gammaproteobacteria bacterium]|nr:MAG: hypothetical protein CSA49_06835 [Gammaproteobacteria bacterium]